MALTSAVLSGYQSRFGNWEARASVRTKPRRILDEHLDGKLFFPTELVPALAHPAVQAVTDAELTGRILMHRLHAYLTFTSDLEQLVVNPVTQQLSRRRLGFELPEPMLRDAYKICVDESWHALFSEDLADQIVADHAEDEGRHHAFYAEFFDHAWRQLGARQRTAIGARLPEFIRAFLAPDTRVLSALLRLTPLDRDTVRGVVEESSPPARVQGTLRKAAASTLRIFERSGVFADAGTRDRFASHGLVDA